MSPVLPTQPTRRQATLAWLIHSMGALIAGASASLALYLISVMTVQAFEGGRGTLGWIGVLIPIFLVLALLGFFVKRGWDMFQKINAVTVADFSSVFALLLAYAWYHLLPAHLPQNIAGYCASHPLLAPLAEQGPGLTYRAVLAFIAFYFFFKLTKTWLMQVLGLDPIHPSKKSPPDAPEIPEFPQKSPLIQL